MACCAASYLHRVSCLRQMPNQSLWEKRQIRFRTADPVSCWESRTRLNLLSSFEYVSQREPLSSGNWLLRRALRHGKWYPWVPFSVNKRFNAPYCVASSSPQPVIRFSLHASPPLGLSDAEQGHDSGQGCQETDQRAEDLRQPRSTRDPFADEWEDILAFVSAHQGYSGGQHRELERLHPGRHTPSQLTTLALGLRKIRSY